MGCVLTSRFVAGLHISVATKGDSRSKKGRKRSTNQRAYLPTCCTADAAHRELPGRMLNGCSAHSRMQCNAVSAPRFTQVSTYGRAGCSYSPTHLVEGTMLVPFGGGGGAQSLRLILSFVQHIRTIHNTASIVPPQIARCPPNPNTPLPCPWYYYYYIRCSERVGRCCCPDDLCATLLYN